MPRRRLSAEDAREAILAAAEELLVEAGPGGLRLTEIAARAGVAHANISYHFGNVAELQAQLARRIASGLADEIAAVYAHAGPDLPIEFATARTFAVYKEGGYARLLAWLALSGNEPDFDALGEKLTFVCAAIAAHPALAGPHNAARRRTIVPVVQLATLAAVGHGLVGDRFYALFPPDAERPSLPRLFADLFAPSFSEATP